MRALSPIVTINLARKVRDSVRISCRYLRGAPSQPANLRHRCVDGLTALVSLSRANVSRVLRWRVRRVDEEGCRRISQGERR